MPSQAASSPEPESVTSDSVRTYLQEIGRTPLLTHEQEIQLGKQVQLMMGLFETQKSLASMLQREPTLQEWSDKARLNQAELKAQLQQGHRAREKMIRANLRLVVDIAKRYQKRGLELLDLVQEGSLGLKRGVEKYDPTKGYRFSTYAYHWIRQAVTRALAEKSRTIRLPIHINEKLNKIKRTQRSLYQKLQRTPTQNEVAQELGLKPKQMHQILAMARQPVSLELPVGEEEDTLLGGLLEQSGLMSDDYLVQTELKEHLHWMMSYLSPQQRQVLSLRYGLEGNEPLNLAKIGQSLGFSRERARQVEAEALKQLRIMPCQLLRASPTSQ